MLLSSSSQKNRTKTEGKPYSPVR